MRVDRLLCTENAFKTMAEIKCLFFPFFYFYFLLPNLFNELKGPFCLNTFFLLIS